MAPWKNGARRAAPSTFLRPFAPPALLGFVATMDALTPTAAGFRGQRPIGPSARRQVSLLNVSNLPTVLSPTTHCRPRQLVCESAVAYRAPSQGPTVGLRLRQWLAGSPRQQAESSSLPTDRSFASRCSPPLLAETQLRSATACRPDADRDLPEAHPADSTRAQAHKPPGLSRGSFGWLLPCCRPFVSESPRACPGDGSAGC